MSDIDIKDLFNANRIPGGWRNICLIVYAPIGLVLFLVRLIFSAILWLLGILLPDSQSLRRFLHHGFSLALGIIVKINPESEIRDKKTRIIVANSISALDHFTLYKAAEALTPTIWELPNAIGHALGLRKMDMRTKDILISNIKECLSSSECDIAVQPEFSATNNRIALLKFNSWPFSIENSVQPVIIQGWRPDILGVNLTSISSTWWTDVFWFMFVPCTVFSLRYLEVKTNTDHELLARQVERDIAAVLNLRTTNFTVADKFEYEKRCVAESNARNRTRTRASGNSQGIAAAAPITFEMQRMVRQVRDVLPFVPRYVIIRDLLKTGNVDVTVANLLDGIVTYTPETTNSNASSASSNGQSSSSSSSSSSASRRGHESTTENLSFEERKANMYAAAREKYIKKHGINIS